MTSPTVRRHRLDAIGLRSPVKEVNTVAMPWVDMVEDVRLIREGWGERLANNRWRINKRVYVQEDGTHGTMYPESGAGLVTLTRSQFRALAIIQHYNEDAGAAEFRLRREKGISAEDIDFVREILREAVRP